MPKSVRDFSNHTLRANNTQSPIRLRLLPSGRTAPDCGSAAKCLPSDRTCTGSLPDRLLSIAPESLLVVPHPVPPGHYRAFATVLTHTIECVLQIQCPCQLTHHSGSDTLPTKRIVFEPRCKIMKTKARSARNSGDKWMRDQYIEKWCQVQFLFSVSEWKAP